MNTSDLPNSADERYEAFLAEHKESSRRWRRVLARICRTRRLLAYACGLCLLASYFYSDFAAGFLIAAAVAFTVVCLVTPIENRVQRLLVYANDMAIINQLGLARRRRRWDLLPDTYTDDQCPDSQLGSDLDLFGEASVMQLTCTAETGDGISTISKWLSAPARPIEIEHRQRTALSIAPQIQWRQELQRLCIPISQNAAQVGCLKDWASMSFDFAPWAMVRKYTRVLRLLVPFCVILFFFFPMVSLIVMLAIVLSNLVLTIACSGSLHTWFEKILITPEAPSYDCLSNAFLHIRVSSQLGDSWPDSVAVSGQAVEGLRRLERILVLQAISRHALTMILIYLPLQAILLWDVQVYMLADKWRCKYGNNVAKWFKMLGEVEALSSFASLSYEQPDWAFPEIDETSPPSFVALQLGHPLLPDQSRVANDVTLGPPGSLLLITGSNMGGKSTLLRAIGVNAVLAQAGAPCCCRRLKMTPLYVMTSVAVSDSLIESTSLFMAQLLNIKRIVGYIRAHDRREDSLPVMYLLDEILNGTNMTDRRVAIEGLVAYLLQSRAIGVMTTHDLDIATKSVHKDSYRTYYLCHQQLDGDAHERLLFDYKLRPGVAPSSNALSLFGILGLPPQ